MAENSSNKVRILKLLEYLMEETDEDHPVGSKELSEELKQQNVACDRKTLAGDIQCLIDNGYPIEDGINVGHQSGYYYKGHRANLKEMRLLMEAVKSADFITAEETASLIKHISYLCSKYHRDELLSEEIRIKSSNAEKSIAESLDVILKAVSEGVKISYAPLQVDLNGNFRKKPGDVRKGEPMGVVLEDGKHYAAIYKEEIIGGAKGGRSDLVEFRRIDRMDNIAILDKEPVSAEALEYADKHRRIISTKKHAAEELTEVEMEITTSAVELFRDWFGSEIVMERYDGEQHRFRVKTKVVVSHEFFGKMFMISPIAKLIGPQSVVDKYLEMARGVLETHNSVAGPDKTKAMTAGRTDGMVQCVCCGMGAQKVICKKCLEKTDIKSLCYDITHYSIGSGANALWDDLAQELENPYDFRRLYVEKLAEEVQYPEKDIILMHSAARDTMSVDSDKREWFLSNVDLLLTETSVSTAEKQYLLALKLNALLKSYLYMEAEETAKALNNMKKRSVGVNCNLAEFYTLTRRYEEAFKALDAAANGNPDEGEKEKIELMRREAELRKLGKNKGGKQEYLPNPVDAKLAYYEFLNSIGIETLSNGGKHMKPDKIAAENYPQPKEHRKADFNSFVAFDIETTGFSPARDSITEIAAIRVVDGQVVETGKFQFQELVHPHDRRIPAEVENLTGITNEMVKNAKQIWDVFPGFAEFIGNDILVGYNCMAFDSKFLVRAGRYSNLIINNEYFDVMKMAKQFNFASYSLDTVSRSLGIKNPKAHRALADAITTAKVYLELLYRNQE